MDVKPPTTFDEQITLLQKRNCRIEDPAFCTQVLQQINYYHLSAYFLPFRLADGTYRDGTSIPTRENPRETVKPNPAPCEQGFTRSGEN